MTRTPSTSRDDERSTASREQPSAPAAPEPGAVRSPIDTSLLSAVTESIQYPVRRRGALRSAAYGTGLLSLSLIAIPWLFLSGFFWQVVAARATYGPTYAPPTRFTNWGDLLIDGYRLTVAVGLTAAGLIIPPTLIWLGIRWVVLGLPPTATGSLVAVWSLPVGTAVGTLAASYVVPAGIRFAVVRDSAVAVCSFTTLGIALSGRYLIAWLTGSVLTVVGTLLTLGVSQVPVVAPLLTPLAAYLTLTTVVHFLAAAPLPAAATPDVSPLDEGE